MLDVIETAFILAERRRLQHYAPDKAGRWQKMNVDLANRTCVPCRGGVAPLKGDALRRYLDELGNQWEAVRDHHLEKVYKFRNFRQALEFTVAVGEIAEREGHHPEITLAWGRVVLSICTHKIDGLTESDFVLAAKADRAFAEAGCLPQ